MKPANAPGVVVDIGSLHNYVSAATRDFASHSNWQSFVIGRDDLEYPSFGWQEGGYPDNNYLYHGVFFVGINHNTVRFNEATCNDFRTSMIRTPENEYLHIRFSLTDELADSANSVNYFAIRCINNVYAWSNPILDDFLIYEYQIMNNSDSMYSDVYTGLYMDCDVSSAAGGSSEYAFWRDDMPAFFYGTDINGNPETISYMFDDDNPNIPGDDTGGKLDPKESLGYIGSRVVKSPATKNGLPADQACGHHWWDWGSDPWIGREYYNLMKKEIFRQSPGSPHDMRYLQSAGPWDLPAGDTLTVAYAIGIGYGLEGLRRNLQYAYDLYQSKDKGPKITAYRPQADSLLMYAGESIDFKVECAGQDSLNFRWMLDDAYLAQYDPELKFTPTVQDTGWHYVIAIVDGPRYRSYRSWDIDVRPAKKFALSANYPNPFNSTTNIPFELEKDGIVKLTIYDVLGRKVKTLLNKPLTFGKHQVQWDGRDALGRAVSSGIYFFELKSGKFSQTRRLLILR